MNRAHFATILIMAIAAFLVPGIPALAADEAAEMEKAAKIIGPLQSDNACENCHAREVEVWKKTPHFSTYVKRHQSARAKEIQANLSASARVPGQGARVRVQPALHLGGKRSRSRPAAAARPHGRGAGGV